MVGSIKAGVMSNPMFIKRPRNVRNPKGVRIRAALRAAAGLLLFFLLLRSDVLPLWVCGVLLAASILLGICDVYADYRAQASPAAVARCVADAVVPVACHRRHYAVGRLCGGSGRPATACMLLGLGAVSFAACLYSLWRWRRLRSDAELRLWQLRMKRRKLTASRRMQANM